MPVSMTSKHWYPMPVIAPRLESRKCRAIREQGIRHPVFSLGKFVGLPRRVCRKTSMLAECRTEQIRAEFLVFNNEKC